MKLLFAPWRADYSKSSDNTKKENATTEDCIFCKHCTQDNNEHNKKHYILQQTDKSIVLLNLYPYNAGHLLVLPKKHVATLDALSNKERADLVELVSKYNKLLVNTLGAQGINVGMNLGKAAGAGIPSHLHIHLVPRWTGDTNFLATVGNTKTISFDLNEIYKKLKKSV